MPRSSFAISRSIFRPAYTVIVYDNVLPGFLLKTSQNTLFVYKSLNFITVDISYVFFNRAQHTNISENNPESYCQGVRILEFHRHLLIFRRKASAYLHIQSSAAQSIPTSYPIFSLSIQQCFLISSTCLKNNSFLFFSLTSLTSGAISFTFFHLKERVHKRILPHKYAAAKPRNNSKKISWHS